MARGGQRAISNHPTREHEARERGWAGPTHQIEPPSQAATQRLVGEEVEVALERGHDGAVVVRQLASDERYRALNLGLGEEAEKAHHGRASVVDFHDAALLLLLRVHLLREPKWVKEVEREDPALAANERRVVARLAAAHVVLGLVLVLLRLELVLIPPLEDADGEDDLPLAALRDRVPERRHAAHLLELRPRLAVHGHGERPGEALLVHEEPHKAGHGDAAVLELSLADEADGRIIGLVEKFLLGKLERVEDEVGDSLLRREVLELGARRRH
mmetsp:Transcript_16143/g.37626  ORF Transcript_16143/g.37626 Transcript_16143/m.37626 type:complete len:273 (+) Transcript_16143:60-878(+)